ncbi:MAG: hypothetical protein QXO79_05605 [Nitrososphaerota archaeon]
MERVKREMGLGERLLSYIPGYRGYKEKELRRETDRLVRMKVVSILNEAKNIMNAFQSPQAIRKIAVDEDARLLIENARSEFDRVVQRIDRAVAGYAGLFDAVKVREDKLDAILQHDLSLIERAERVKTLASEVSGSQPASAEWKEKVRELRAALTELDGLVDARSAILRGLAEVVG